MRNRVLLELTRILEVLQSQLAMAAKNCDQYCDKIILGPMVRIGTLPFRLLALRYGADLVYSEEIIDWRLVKSKRIFNEELGIVEYVDQSDGTNVFSTCQEEKSKVILQLGTSDPERALKVGLLVQDDIAGLDINMGCPKDFSLKGGMGAALLKQPEKVHAILSTLTANLKIPVTCKIRVLATVEETIKFVKMIESTGVSAVAIHGRMTHERRQHPNRNSFIREVASQIQIPVIANGGSNEIKEYSDVIKFKETTGCSSVMLCRCGIYNASIFKPEGKLDLQEVMKDYIKLAVDYNDTFVSTKYTLLYMLRDQQESPFGKQFLATQTLNDICELYALSDYFKASKRYKITEHYRTWAKHKATETNENGNDENNPSSKKTKLDGEAHGKSGATLVERCIFLRSRYPSLNDLPKTILFNWTRKNKFSLPVYETECVDKRFRSVVTVGGKQFMTDLWEKNKKQAEQAAAMACIKAMKIADLPEELSVA